MPATNLYGKAYANLLGGEVAGDTFAIDFLSDTIKASLHTSSYTPNLDTHETFSQVTNEVTGTGYTAGGVTLGSKTITYTAADSWGTSRANTTAYAVGDIVKPATPNGHLYRCIIAGTSGGSPPTFPTVSGNTVADGSVTWAEIGRGVVQIDAGDPQWTSATIASIKYCVIYKAVGTSPDVSPLIALLDLDGPHTVTNGTFTVQLHTLGIYTHSTP